MSLVEAFINDETTSEFAGTATTALKNGVTLDESTLNSLQKDSLTMTGGATGITGAVQDLVTQDQRAPIFDHMADIVTGSVTPEDAVQAVIDNIAED